MGSRCFTALPTPGIVLHSLYSGWEMVPFLWFSFLFPWWLVLEIFHVFHGHSGFLLWRVCSNLSPILRIKRLFVFLLWICQFFIYSGHTSFVRWQIYFLSLWHAYSFAKRCLNSVFLGLCLCSLQLCNFCLTKIKLIRIVLLLMFRFSNAENKSSFSLSWGGE